MLNIYPESLADHLAANSVQMYVLAYGYNEKALELEVKGIKDEVFDYKIGNRYEKVGHWHLSFAVVITKSHSALMFEDSSAFAIRAFLFVTVTSLY